LQGDASMMLMTESQNMINDMITRLTFLRDSL